MSAMACGVLVAASSSCSREKPPETPPPPAPAPAPAPVSPSVTFTAAANASSPSSVVLKQIRTIDRSSGQTWALMEIVNQTDRPIVPDIRFHYRDGSGQAVSEEAGAARPDHVNSPPRRGCSIPMLVMRAGEKIPCFTEVPRGATTATYDIAPQNEKAERVALDLRTDLEVVGAKLESAGGGSFLGAQNQVVGFVENRTRVPLSGVQVQASFYDATGGVVGLGEARLNKPIKPGARAPFQLLARVMLAPAATFSAMAWTVGPRAEPRPAQVKAAK